MTKNDEELLIKRVGILEETVSDLLTILRERANTTHDYNKYNNLLQDSINKANAAERKGLE